MTETLPSVTRRISPHDHLTPQRRIANAAVLHGPHGAVTRLARQQRLSRQTLYRDTQRLLRDLDPNHAGGGKGRRRRKGVGTRRSYPVTSPDPFPPAFFPPAPFPPAAELVTADCHVIVCASHGRNLDGSESDSMAAVNEFIQENLQGWEVIPHDQEDHDDEEPIANAILEDVLSAAEYEPELAGV